MAKGIGKFIKEVKVGNGGLCSFSYNRNAKIQPRMTRYKIPEKFNSSQGHLRWSRMEEGTERFRRTNAKAAKLGRMHLSKYCPFGV